MNATPGRWRVYTGLGAALLLCGGLAGAAHAQQDMTYGGDARSFAMGGAGVAILQQQAGFRQNPATLSFELRTFGIQYPSLAYRSEGGPSLGRVGTYLFSGQNADEARNLAIESAKGDSVIGANGSVSVRYSRFEIGAQAVALGRVQPNASLQAWANNGGTGNVPADARADVLSAGYYTVPTLAAGFIVPEPRQSRYTYGVGVRAKYLTGVYTHYIADVNALTGQSGASPVPAPEMGGRKSLTKNGIAFDLGFLANPRRAGKDVSIGVVVANAIQTPLTFNGTDRNGNAKRYNLLSTTATAGVAYQKMGLIVAADWADISGSAGKTQGRFGAEYQFKFPVAVRAGYNTDNGATWGFGFYGLDVAFGKKQPLEVIKTINF